MTDRLKPHQIARGRSGHETLMDLTDLGYVIVHPDDVLDWIERLSENPLGTPIYSNDTPQVAYDAFMDRFAAAEQSTTNPKETP